MRWCLWKKVIRFIIPSCIHIYVLNHLFIQLTHVFWAMNVLANVPLNWCAPSCHGRNHIDGLTWKPREGPRRVRSREGYYCLCGVQSKMLKGKSQRGKKEEKHCSYFTDMPGGDDVWMSLTIAPSTVFIPSHDPTSSYKGVSIFVLL